MATKKYLDLDGLTRYDGKIKQKIPTKTSDLTNDSGFITDSKVVVIEYGEDILYSTVLNYLQNGYSVFCKCHIDVDIQGTNDFQYIPAIWESNNYNIITFSSMTSNDVGVTVFRDISLEYQEENGVETYGYWSNFDEYFQNELVSGSNIKTINNQSILGSGNINISGGLSFDDIYPVGSIYMSVNATSPSTLFGGTRERIGVGRTLISAGGDTDAVVDSNNYTGRGTISNIQASWFPAGQTGGETDHTLTTAEMPSHQHQLLVRNNSGSVTNTWCLSNEKGTARWQTDQGTRNTGNGNSHNIMQPYFAVYMWKRTA